MQIKTYFTQQSRNRHSEISRQTKLFLAKKAITDKPQSKHKPTENPFQPTTKL